MILSGHQPAYLPWLGLFHKMTLADAFCIVDDVTYSKDFINRNAVKTARGRLWLTVPVDAHGTKRICDVRIVGSSWRRKHVRTIVSSYSKAPYFGTYAPEILSVIAKPHAFLSEFTNELLRLLTQLLGFGVNFIVASDYDFAGRKSEYVLNVCSRLGASAYVFGSHGRQYVNEQILRAGGVEPIFQEYRHPVYRQRYGAFVPRLSVIDLLFNEGPRSLGILLRDNQPAHLAASGDAVIFQSTACMGNGVCSPDN